MGSSHDHHHRVIKKRERMMTDALYSHLPVPYELTVLLYRFMHTVEERVQIASGRRKNDCPDGESNSDFPHHKRGY
jgi:hypothetical protein